MIDPKNVTKFDRSDVELREYFLFCTFVAGKNADVQARKLDDFLYKVPMHTSFVTGSMIQEGLRTCKVGQYSRLDRTLSSFNALMGYDRIKLMRYLREGTPAQLSAEFFGVGPKTSRYFILHSRADARCAALDTHILKWLTLQGVGHDFKNTPPMGQEYLRLENEFLERADKLKISAADLDLKVWMEMSGRITVHGHHK